MPYEGSIGSAWATTLASLEKLRSAWPARGWSWDGSHSCVASTFSVEFEDQAKAAAKHAFAGAWTSKTIAQAPSPLRDLAERTGGLRPGQLLLVTDSRDSVAFAYGLWWPWGDGITISARIGIDGLVHGDVIRRMRQIFGAET